MSDERVAAGLPDRQRADAAKRADMAFEARVAGATWDEAAEIAGFANGPNACRAVANVFGSLPTPDREELRAVARARGEAVWRQALRDVEERRPGAVTAAVRVLDLMVRLDGLSAPDRVEVGLTPTDVEIQRFIDRVLGPHEEEADIFDGESIEIDSSD